jgi:putative ABC transport system permease protein
MHARLLTWSLRHRRWRHVLNALTIAVTAAVVMVFVSVMAELLAFVRKNADREVTRILLMPKMVDGELPLALGNTLEHIDGVRTVLRYRALGGRHPSGARSVIAGEEPGAFELTQDFFPVTPEAAAAWRDEKLGAIVTEATARDLNLTVGQVTEVPTPRGALKIKVVGLSRGALVAHRIAVHFDYIQEFAGNPGTCNFRVFTKPADYERVARAIEAQTKNGAMPVHAVSSSRLAQSEAKQAAMVPAVLGFLGLFLIFTTALTLANNAASSIRERRMETASMRVMGYHRRTILRLLLGESVLVGLAGGLVALVVMWLVFRNGVQLTPGEINQIKPVTIGVAGAVAGLLASILVPLVGALPAAVAATRQKLVDALRDA